MHPHDAVKFAIQRGALQRPRNCHKCGQSMKTVMGKIYNGQIPAKKIGPRRIWQIARSVLEVALRESK